MAATAAAAVGSSFSQSIQTLKCVRFKQLTAGHSVLKIPSVRMISSISHSYFTHELFPASSTVQKWRMLNVSAAVAQQETEATTQVEESLVEEEENEGEAEDQAETEAEDQAETEAETESPVNTKLYVGNLPFNVDSAQLAGIIQEYGSPELVEVLYNRETGKSKGFAFVTMSTVEDCNAVIENLDGREYLGRTLRVNFSDKPRPREPLYPETEYKLFIGNLSWSVTSESLTQAFQEYGNVVGARVLYDGETGRSRGYGFVCYSTKSEMEAALQSLNGVELEGRALRVSLAQGRRS
ncbi:28 kDa ribonucleoprotein, chloroplastic-like [Durio zibethinus]|uniref:28 kDa ribonucleoprotein, chloroplastic-like n=1 Tax=Durio zibethinus TaxID=66656 RepID=A0A6P6A8A7_DURZI|nr:28 kDa ribonucleoprotein, chloroplastic-like [Durio zibethinus]